MYKKFLEKFYNLLQSKDIVISRRESRALLLLLLIIAIFTTLIVTRNIQNGPAPVLEGDPDGDLLTGNY